MIFIVNMFGAAGMKKSFEYGLIPKNLAHLVIFLGRKFVNYKRCATNSKRITSLSRGSKS